MSEAQAHPLFPGQRLGRGARLVIGLLACGPLAGVVIAILMSLFDLGSGRSVVLSGFSQSIGWASIAGAIIGWPVTLVVGLPIHVVLLRRKARRIGAYLIGGALGGALSGLAFDAYLAVMSHNGISALPTYVALFAVFLAAGAIAAAIFWAIRRPDRDAPQAIGVAAAFD